MESGDRVLDEGMAKKMDKFLIDKQRKESK